MSAVAWITITPALVAASGHEAVITAARTLALQAGQADPLPVLISSVTLKVRNAIGFKNSAQLDADTTTIPPSLSTDCALWIIRELKGRLNKDLNEKEKADQIDWRMLLRELNAGEKAVETPLNAIASTAQAPAGTGVQVVATTCRKSTRRDLSRF